MKYKNAKEIFPDWLLIKLQDYAQGEIIYVPKKDAVKSGWGEANGTREKYILRNSEIRELYRNGESIEEIAGKVHLSEYSIKKIVSRKFEEINRSLT